MKEIKIYKAQRISEHYKPPESITIIIDEETPNITHDPEKECGDFYEKANAHYTEQAKKLFDALLETLPGGTIDRLLICMLENAKGYFKVSHIS